MSKQNKKSFKKAEPAKKQEVVEVKSDKASGKATTSELIVKLADFFKKEGAVGYICGIVGADAKILPYAGASSIGDLLTIKYVIDKEISRLIDGTSKTTSEVSAASEQ
jgi:hypothetical protein